MKKITFFVFLSLTVLATFSFASGETPIQVKEKPAFSYAYMSFSGSFKTMSQNNPPEL
jgi:hypothetical protein